MLHNFENSLIHEREQADRADAFYRNVLQVSEIKRFNTDSEADMKMQRQDVDVLLKLNGISYRVSEKFRDRDYGDLYVEVYSKYPKTIGWMHTGSPNAILYFTPNAVYWITHISLSSFCLQTLFPLIPAAWYEELFQSHSSIVSKNLLIKEDSNKINLIQAHNHPSDGNNWETIGISAAFSVFEKYGVKIKRMYYQ
ncbi:MAG TPA: hypothetical protein VIK55_01065 [Paludibacter sp.]